MKYRLSLWWAAGVMLATAAWAGEFRTWKDVSGNFSIEAELISSSSDGKVVLRSKQGKESVVPLDKLSTSDREYIRDRMTTSSADSKESKSAAETASVTDKEKSKSNNSAKSIKASTGTAAELKLVREKAELFYNDLRNESRNEARDLLTEVGKKLVEAGQSPLKGLPVPDSGGSSLRIGKAKIQRAIGMVPVQVKLNGDFQQTALHLRKVNDNWQVFAISAKVGRDEVTINFEASVARPGQSGDGLATLLGKPLEVTGATLDGRPVSSAGLRGKVVLVDFWATWCGPCRKEIPNILENYKKYHGAGFEVMAVSLDEDLDDLRDFLTSERPPWIVVAGKHPEKRMATSIPVEISGIPAFVLIGRDGKVAEVQCRGEELGKALGRLLKH